MGRVTSCFVLVLCVAAASSAAANHDDPWFPGWGWTPSPPPPDFYNPPPLFPSPTGPSPYYNAPPYDAPPPYYAKYFEFLSPSDSPTDAPSYANFPWIASGPGSDSFHLLASSLVDNPDQWPAPWTPLTTVSEAFGDDAEKVYGDTSLLDGLSSKGDDGYSRLLKEGITALLNTVDKHYKYTEDDVKKCFSFQKSLSSESAATVQAHMFEDANTEYVQTRA